MKRFGVLFTGIMILALVFMPSVVFADDPITQQDIDEGLAFCDEYPVRLVLDGEEIIFEEGDMPPVIIRERTLIPARAVFEAMGGVVDWDEEKEEVQVALDDTIVVLTIGSNVAWVNEEAQILEVPALIIARPGELYGRTMIPARFTAEALGCEVDWEDVDRTVIIASPYLSGEENGEEGEGGDEENGENGGETGEPGTGELPFGFAPLPMMNERAAQRLIFIDVGHGGRDPGTTGDKGKPNELDEKTVNLEIGLYLRDYLREAGARIYMSRETDRFIVTDERPEMANNMGADLFVSIHNNASETSLQANGTEVHYYSKVDEEERDEKELYGIYSKDVAERVQKEMLRALGTFDRGTKNSPRLIVLNRTAMPAIVIEGAFLSNAGDLALIRSEDFARRYAYATAKALIEIMNETF